MTTTTIVPLPKGFRTLIEHCRIMGIKRRETAARAARMGNIPGAQLIRLPGSVHPIWVVPTDCDWKPNPNGRRYTPYPTKGEQGK